MNLIDIDRLPISKRAKMALRQIGVRTVDDLMAVKLWDVLRVKGAGRKSANEILRLQSPEIDRHTWPTMPTRGNAMTLPSDYEKALANFDAARARWNVTSGTDEVLDWIRDYMVSRAPAAALAEAEAEARIKELEAGVKAE